MSKAVNIKGMQYLPASEAGRRFGYTNDYISKLAREQKILGTKVGRQWFVSPRSLEKFATEVERNKKLRSESLRGERKKEQIKVGEISSITGIEVRTFEAGALIKTWTVMTLGIVTGFVMFNSFSSAPLFTVPSYEALFGQAKQLAVSIYNVGGAAEEVKEEQPAEEVAGAHLSDAESSKEGLLLIENDEHASERIEHIKNSFSDEVIVEEDEVEGTGVITPVFREKTDEQYRYLLVPIEESS